MHQRFCGVDCQNIFIKEIADPDRIGSDRHGVMKTCKKIGGNIPDAASVEEEK